MSLYSMKDISVQQQQANTGKGTHIITFATAVIQENGFITKHSFALLNTKSVQMYDALVRK